MTDGDITLTSDEAGAATLVFDAGTTWRRVLDTSQRYQVADIVGQPAPTVTDFQKMRQTIEIRFVLLEQRTSVFDVLVDLIESAPNGTSFTLTYDRKTGSNESFKVVPFSQVILQRDGGEGEMDTVTAQFLIVTEVLAG